MLRPLQPLLRRIAYLQMQMWQVEITTNYYYYATNRTSTPAGFSKTAHLHLGQATSTNLVLRSSTLSSNEDNGTRTKRRQRNEGVSQERIDPRGRTADQPHKMPVALKAAAAATVMLHLDTPT